MKWSIVHTVLIALVVLVAGCSEKETASKEGQKNERDTFFLFKQTGMTKDLKVLGDLYEQRLDEEREKIAGNVLAESYAYSSMQNKIYFQDEEHALYAYEAGKDKVHVADDVASYNTEMSKDYIFYYNEDNDLYAVSNEEGNEEKIAGNVEWLDVWEQVVYFKTAEGDFLTYNLETREEQSIASNIHFFKVLNKKGDVLYTNDDLMLYKKDANEEAERLTSNQVTLLGLEELKDRYIYPSIEKLQMSLYETSKDDGQTHVIAEDVNDYVVEKEVLYYVTEDEILYKYEDGEKHKITSEVTAVDIIDKQIIVRNEEHTLFEVSTDGQKKSLATNVESLEPVANNYMYVDDQGTMYKEGHEVLAKQVTNYAVVQNQIGYVTQDEVLYVSAALGEPEVVLEDVSDYTFVTYGNTAIYTKKLTISDIIGHWKNDEEGYFITFKEDEIIFEHNDESYPLAVREADLQSMEVAFGDQTYTLTFGDKEIDFLGKAFEKISNEELKQELAQLKEEEQAPALVEPAPAPAPPASESASGGAVSSSDINAVMSEPDDFGASAVDSAITGFLQSFISYDTSNLASYVDSSSSLLQQHSTYVQQRQQQGYLYNNIFIQYTDVQRIGTEQYEVWTEETFHITEPGGEKNKIVQKCKYELRFTGDRYVITGFELL